VRVLDSADRSFFLGGSASEGGRRAGCLGQLRWYDGWDLCD